MVCGKLVVYKHFAGSNNYYSDVNPEVSPQ